MTDKPRKRWNPQTVIFEKGYNPQWSEGAAIPPVFRTSTFVFKSAEEGKRAFAIAYGMEQPRKGETPSLIYTRVNNPNSEMVEDKISAWDNTEAAALFSSGMGAISGTCLALLRPGDTIAFSDPLYGGTEYLFRKMLPNYNIRAVPFPAGSRREVIEDLVKKDPTVKMIYIESPANPTIVLTDIGAARKVALKYSTPERKIVLAVDNTFMGPIFCCPAAFGADLCIYSATKFIGGHSDLVAGLVLGSKELIGQVKAVRTILGSNSDPDTAWLILRSLGTLQLRMEKQQENAVEVARYLKDHKRVQRVAYPGFPEMGDYQVELFRSQCTGTGSLISFWIEGGEPEAFAILNRLKLMKLAVSLGGIETLIEHPYSMTHADMSDEEKVHAGITPNMIRLSVGLEAPEDLIADLEQAMR
ncbi:MAG: aminotransferase class I/II-fold pyridoxal phosphate-dependent enzyme [Acidobacteria bacterium]|nr:aminotransferase class I/II-fold pyridoxal phosphate-dependent enzyme [Acidobacteriota bacterium]